MVHSNSSSDIKSETIIIGGGISGLACARQLFDAGKDFLLITDNLGGRIHYSRQGNYLGAVLINKDYTNIRKYAPKFMPNYPWNGYFWNGQKAVNALFLMDFTKIPTLSKIMKKFRQSMIRLREETPHTCQKTLMERDPYMKHLTEQSAADFVQEHGLEKLNERLLNPTISIAMFGSYDKINAFNYCIGLMATGSSAYFADFTKIVDKLTLGYEDKIRLENVISLEESSDEGSFQVKTSNNSYHARNVVIATPARNTNAFYDKAPSAVKNSPINVFHVEGKRRKIYKPGKSLVFKPGSDVECFFALKKNFDILYTPVREPDFDRYYPQYTLVDKLSWKTGTQLSTHEWRPLQMKENLFTIGDYNICGLEDSFLTGLFAANKIIRSS